MSIYTQASFGLRRDGLDVDADSDALYRVAQKVRSHFLLARIFETHTLVCVIFAARCYTSAAYAVMRCPPVRLSVFPSVCHVREFCQNE